MSLKTIQCQLFADESVRKYLWQLMADRNTPLVNELLRLVSLHPDFENWRRKGKLPRKEVTAIAKALKTDSRFKQPAKFSISAEKTVIYTFESWLAIQQRLQQKIANKLSWLRMLRTDDELVTDCGRDIEKIRSKAQALLGKHQPLGKSAESNKTLRSALYQAYDKTKNSLTRSAIAYLLKNHNKIPSENNEDTDLRLEYRQKIEVQIKILTQQLESRLPQGRDLTGERFLNTLELATHTISVDIAQACHWESQLSKKPNLVPFPFLTESSMDLRWKRIQENKIDLNLAGLGKREFTIGCNRRQLRDFQQFLSDYRTREDGNKQHTTSLFLLRSAKFLWVEKTGSDEPWNVHQLYLHCTLDTRCQTAEGTELVRQEKEQKNTKILKGMVEKQKEEELTPNQNNFVQRTQSTLDKLDRTFKRPSKPLYQGRSNIIVAVSMGLEHPATVVAIRIEPTLDENDATTQIVLAYLSPKQLLGENYRLLNQQRNLKRKQRQQNYKAQKQGLPCQFSNSNLGEYIDRLLAKAIVHFAQSHNAASIALPELSDIRLNVQSEIDAKAQAKIPGYIEGQKKYARKVRINLHNWSYGRLRDSIINKAAQSQIAIEDGDRSFNASPVEQAKEIAMSAYAKRKVS